MERVIVRWSDTAKAQLGKLPRSDRRGLLNKIDDLRLSDHPKENFKPVYGPLQGNCRVCFMRYRAVYSVNSEELANGDFLHHVFIRFIATGERLETGKQEIYQFARKLIDMGFGDSAGCEISDTDK